ncbi:unnamed protein product [Phytophthora lilii]|uniref:Unnamed protein product n=1 Tax=Phytophthora lilii TaxID=2077276 RepID=A0A9W6TSR7_9STRA|nr:unnamed protein product [Phytophthora lilii]
MYSVHCRHDFIAHDASMVHTDAYFGVDPMTVNMTLADDVLARADLTGKINTTAIAQDRALLCETSNPECNFNDQAKLAAFSEAALLLLGFGQGDFVSADHAWSFLVEEQIPNDYVKAAEPLTSAIIGAKVAELQS